MQIRSRTLTDAADSKNLVKVVKPLNIPGFVKYQDFIDFAKIIRNYYGYEHGRRLTQGEFVRTLFENICDADIDQIVSDKSETLSTYLSKRSIYANISMRLLASVNSKKFALWIGNRSVAHSTLKHLLKACRAFIEDHPQRFRYATKKELLKLGKVGTVGDFAAEIFINILTAPDPLYGRSRGTRSIPEALDTSILFDSRRNVVGSKNYERVLPNYRQDTKNSALATDVKQENESVRDFDDMSIDEIFEDIYRYWENTQVEIDSVAENTSAIPAIASDVIKGNKKLDKHTKTLNEIKSLHNKTQEKIESVVNNTGLTPALADEIKEANAKLDEVLKFAPNLDKFDRYLDNETDAALTAFAHNLINDKIEKYHPVEFDFMVQHLKEEVNDALNRAVLARLPDDALAEMEKFMDNNPDKNDELLELMILKANEYKLDLAAITMTTLVWFEKLFKGEVLADNLDFSKLNRTV